VELSSGDFDRAVAEALASLPARARDCLNNVTIEVEEVPAEEDLVANDPPLSPLSLGMFRGVPVPEKTVGDPYSHFPSAIILYQRNLERYARDRDELLEQIGVTLLHEVGHFFGLDEGDLYDRGLD
jgi:predicted Zn-dependent protease with MMP-like domain